MKPLVFFVGGCMLSMTSLVLMIVGLATPHWYIAESEENGNYNYGLFEYCQNGDCINYDDPSSTIRIVQAMEIIAAVGILFSLVIVVVFLVLLGRNKASMEFQQFASYIQGAGVVCSVVGLMVFKFEFDTAGLVDSSAVESYGYSIYLSLTGTLILIVTGPTLLYAGKQMAEAPLFQSPRISPMKH